MQTLQQLASQAAQDLRIDINENGVRIELVEAQLQFIHSFVSGPIAKRAAQSSQLLLKACNNKQRNINGILDLTAGWGVDAFILARHGLQVTLLEHNALIHAILARSLAQLAQAQGEQACAQRLELEQANAKSYLEAASSADRFDCIYLDPMFEAHKSGAKPAKEMQILQMLTDNLDIESCFELALSRARKRVVVKRGAKVAALANARPDLVQRAKTIRFDIYLTA